MAIDPSQVRRYAHGSRVPGWDDSADLSKDPAVVPDPATTLVPAHVRTEIEALMAKYPDIKGADDVTPSVGVANAYDAMQLSALAIAKAGSTKGDDVREGFYKIDRYEGLIKTYDKPFSASVHDAVTETDYVWAQFIDNRILPVASN